jgi:DNA-binding beta-propeller fold protein YncE
MIYGDGEYRYELVEGWGKYPEGWDYKDVAGICVDEQDRVYVLNRGPHPIMVFDRNGTLIDSWGESFFGRAHGSCIGPDGSIYCTDDIDHTVSKFTYTGKLLMLLGDKGVASDSGYVKKDDLFESLATIQRGAPPFNRPTGVSLSSSGDIFISDGYGNARVHRFTSTGDHILSWGEPGNDTGQFVLPHNIWLDSKDRVWVSDRENRRIQIFDIEGNFITQWTDLGRPTDISIDKDNIVFVAELTQTVSIFTMEHKLITRWGSPGQIGVDALFTAPHAIALDSHGDIYVGEVCFTSTKGKIDKGPRAIQKFARV